MNNVQQQLLKILKDTYGTSFSNEVLEGYVLDQDDPKQFILDIEDPKCIVTYNAVQEDIELFIRDPEYYHR